MSTTLNNLGTQAPNGAIFLAQQQNTAQETALNADISNEDALLATQKTQLTNELNTANQILQSIPSQLNQVERDLQRYYRLQPKPKWITGWMR